MLPVGPPNIVRFFLPSPNAISTKKSRRTCLCGHTNEREASHLSARACPSRSTVPPHRQRSASVAFSLVTIHDHSPGDSGQIARSATGIAIAKIRPSSLTHVDHTHLPPLLHAAASPDPDVQQSRSLPLVHARSCTARVNRHAS